MNAKEELLMTLQQTDNLNNVKCVYIYKETDFYNISNIAVLKLGYSEEDWQKFLEALDFTYDHGYGSQELFGNVWFKDGSWLSRAEYDGSEWWNHSTCPEIPEECLQ
jgi:hypothetical protein